MNSSTFADAVMMARRKAQLQGRPLSTQESSGIARGFSQAAGERLLRLSQLEESRRQFELSLAEQRRARKADNCIIITSCTYRNSYEVNISRIYRDFFIGPITLDGYYALANVIVPLMRRFNFVKSFLKHYLVDRLVDHAEFVLFDKHGHRYSSSKPMAQGFIYMCYILGRLNEKISSS